VEQVDVEPRRAGFEAVAQELIEPLRRYLARRTDPATANDVLSETLLARLSAVDAELVRLWAWEQLGPAEIAQAVGMTANAVSIRLHRARQKLKSLLHEYGQPQAEVERP
jgi:RNA polymerase sigma-70 factor (ECF subfamily)